MNGAEQTIETLVRRGVDTCFTNPGTSEMHFVAALDRQRAMRSVLALFEGVATGAADGFGRMTRRPATTLLHLGPGMANGLANLHNARRARTPVVNLVGEHATGHRRYDPPLTTDIEGLARPMSGWVATVTDSSQVAAFVDAAVDAALGPPATVATLVVPADVSWSAVPDQAVDRLVPADRANGGGHAGSARPSTTTGSAPPGRTTIGTRGAVLGGDADPPRSEVREVAVALTCGAPAAVLIGGRATTGDPLRRAAQIAERCHAKLLCETFPARLERGAGVPAVERLAYLAELARLQLAGLEHLVVVDCAVPVSFFAYPDLPSRVVPDGCQVHLLAGPPDDAEAALEALAGELGVGTGSPVPTMAPTRPLRPSGPITAESLAAAVGAVLPEGAVVSDESNTGGLHIPGGTAGAPPHDWLTLTGGAIGQGLPVATGAGVAIAGTGRQVLCLEADGSAMYTIQALWTQARESLDVTTVILDNHAYGILGFELSRVRAGEPGPAARDMLDLSRPDLDFVALAGAMGVPATRAESADELVVQLERALHEPGPALVHVPMERSL